VSVVSVNTFTHTAGYLTANLVRSVTDIIKALGLDPGELPSQALDRGLKIWIETEDLTKLVLEIYNRSTDGLVRRFDFDLDYTYSTGSDGTFWLDTDQVRFAIRKAGLLPSNCSYSVVATTKPGRPDVEGWTSATLRSTDGLTRHAVGTAIGAGSSAAGLAYHSRS
jgi:Bacterial HORMA domain 2